MTIQNPDERFPILENTERLQVATKVAAIALQASQITEDFSHVERIPRYSDGQRENDVEHSYMLAIAAPEIAHSLNLNLDIDTIRRFALAHDLLEIKVGDVATFDLTQGQLAEKKQLENAAKSELCSELPPLTAKDLTDYEAQNTPEAVFVRMVDKLLPVAVDITGDGLRIIREDYGVNSYEELKRSHWNLHARIAEKFGDDFPDLVAAHAELCLMFEAKYLGSAPDLSADEKPRNPTEIELKYLIDIDKLPNSVDLNNVRMARLRQGYIAVGSDGSETRVRSFDDERFELTTKSPGSIARDEQTVKLTQEMFDGLWPQTSGRQVIKNRYYIPLDGLIVELDIYENHLQGLVTAEVEFDGRPTEALIRAKTFEPPGWFGKDISDDLRYKNHNLAEQLPQNPIPLGAKRF